MLEGVAEEKIAHGRTLVENHVHTLGSEIAGGGPGVGHFRWDRIAVVVEHKGVDGRRLAQAQWSYKLPGVRRRHGFALAAACRRCLVILSVTVLLGGNDRGEPR